MITHERTVLTMDDFRELVIGIVEQGFRMDLQLLNARMDDVTSILAEIVSIFIHTTNKTFVIVPNPIDIAPGIHILREE